MSLSFSRRSRLLLTVGIALTGALAFSACSASTPDKDGGDAGTTEKKPLVISLDSSVDILDPQQYRSRAAMVTSGSLVEQLIEQQYDENGLTRVGTDEFDNALAEKYEYNEDRTVLTITLREGLTFADGSPLNAENVVWSMVRGLEGPGYIKVLYPMVGLTSADQFVAVDERTVQITAAFATPLLDKMLAMQPFGILSKEAGEAHKTADDPWAFDWFRENENSSGPYTVAAYDPTTSITLAPNPKYYDQDRIANSGVTIQFVSDPAQRALLLQSGEIDLAQGLPLDQVKELEKVDGLTVVSESSHLLQYLGFNVTAAPFDNPAVRQAVSQALPYDTFVSDVLYGYARPASGMVPEGMVTHDAKINDFSQNMEKAKKTIADAGIPPFKTTLSFKQSSAVEARAAVYIQSALAEIGITVDVRPLPDAEFTQRARGKELPMFLNSFLGWGNDPFYVMSGLLSTGSGNNFGDFGNAKLDGLLQTGFQTNDAAERDRISSEAQQIIFDEMPIIPVWNPNWTFVVRDGVTGVTKDNTEQLRL
ncbi:MAG: ABC transporter substrate-binding protein, partial [Microbacterium sp.]